MDIVAVLAAAAAYANVTPVTLINVLAALEQQMVAVSCSPCNPLANILVAELQLDKLAQGCAQADGQL